jgi:hypothetical protein
VRRRKLWCLYVEGLVLWPLYHSTRSRATRKGLNKSSCSHVFLNMHKWLRCHLNVLIWIFLAITCIKKIDQPVAWCCHCFCRMALLQTPVLVRNVVYFGLWVWVTAWTVVSNIMLLVQRLSQFLNPDLICVLQTCCMIFDHVWSWHCHCLAVFFLGLCLCGTAGRKFSRVTRTYLVICRLKS